MMQIPTIPPLPAGHLVTAAEMNDLAYACTFLLTKPMARIRDAPGGQSLGTTDAVVAMSFTDFDTDGMAGVNANALTVQTPGWYKLRYTVATAQSSTQVTQTYAQSTTGPNNPLGPGVSSGPYWGGYILGTSVVGAGGGTGLWPFYLYAGDFIRVHAVAQVNGIVVTESSINNEGSSLSLEWVSA